MLMMKVFTVFGKANAGKSLFIERGVIASTQEAVAPEDQRGLKLRKILLCRLANVASEFS